MVRKFKISDFHKRIISKKTLFKTLTYIDKNPDLETPILLIDREKLIQNVKSMGNLIPNSRVFYAVKANSDIELLKILKNMGVGFEIASSGELDLLKKLKVPPDKIITSNPVKSPDFIQRLYKYGVKYFVFDSISEIEKLEKWAPGCFGYVRITVPNEGSEWPLSKKFGVELDMAFNLINRANELKIISPVGVTFHVGSQCLNPYNWYIAIDKAKRLFDMCFDAGIKMKILNIGGGYPISYTKIAPNIREIEEKISSYLTEKFNDDIEIFIEPGRAIVGDTGIMVSKIIGTAKRNHENWIYLDVGIFNGLMEAIGGIKYLYIFEQTTPLKEKHNKESFFDRYKKWTIAGPSCDSMDVIEKNVYVDADPKSGQLVLIPSAGAYTLSYASEFNGFPIPKIEIL
ncbi:type III PLP-dependent enzyme [Desulfothermus sp.]